MSAAPLAELPALGNAMPSRRRRYAIVLLAGLQYRLWTGNGSIPDVHRLEQKFAAQQSENDQLRERNATLAAEDRALLALYPFIAALMASRPAPAFAAQADPIASYPSKPVRFIVPFVAGAGMLTQRPDILQSGWFHVKFTCVLGIAISSVYAGRLVGRFEQREANLPTSKQLRIANEIPTLLMMILVGMAVFKPF